MQFIPFSVLVQRGGFYKVTGAALLALILLGCSQSQQKNIHHSYSAPSEPENTLVDFQRVLCEQIWTFDDEAAIKNPLYWLRAMDCGIRLSPTDARAEAHRWSAANWQSTFKQAILLNNGNITPVERRQYLQCLDSYSYDYPSAIRSLLKLWRAGQDSLLQLSEARARYAHLQQGSDTQLDALRQQQIDLNKELALTQRKLDDLTDIERQLSTRRSSDASEGSHGGSGEKNSTNPPENPNPAASSSQDEANQ